jgi:hypothetical protein
VNDLADRSTVSTKAGDAASFCSTATRLPVAGGLSISRTASAMTSEAASAPASPVAVRQRLRRRVRSTTLPSAATPGGLPLVLASMAAKRSVDGTTDTVRSLSGASRRSHASTAARSAGSRCKRAATALRSLASSWPST